MEAAEEAEEEAEEEGAEHHHPFPHKPSNQYRVLPMCEPWENSLQTSMATEPRVKTSSKNAKGTCYSTKTYQALTPPKRRSNLF